MYNASRIIEEARSHMCWNWYLCNSVVGDIHFVSLVSTKAYNLCKGKIVPHLRIIIVRLTIYVIPLPSYVGAMALTIFPKHPVPAPYMLILSLNDLLHLHAHQDDKEIHNLALISSIAWYILPR
jgi:hypothetical protein